MKITTTWRRSLAQILVIGCLAAGANAGANEAAVAQPVATTAVTRCHWVFDPAYGLSYVCPYPQ